ncbi:hypothetical protein CERZMDRAFT_82801 [Cercospora zeae-maydis SCOH1-5]|uniref:Partial AB-hydrolase lipase domain-containing protein n=1 Tax=Cercospora zeae-maydis SCOH1-5 TaxID=717836 RepID=A0A6A6FNZ0_9PEZI|nr:hypothetical protein CERZMDRAFT_82801 [Cercospora zeae-maydis SCOH1-5]
MLLEVTTNNGATENTGPGMEGKKDKVMEYARQAEKLGVLRIDQEDENSGCTQAVEAKWITPFDPVVETADGQRIPGISVKEAKKLNRLRDEAQGREARRPPESALREGKDGTTHGIQHGHENIGQQNEASDATLREAVPDSTTNPLFPPLPLYGPPTVWRTIQCMFFRVTSAMLSLCFLLAIVCGAIVDAVPKMFEAATKKAILKDFSKQRPFYAEEQQRKQEREEAERAWTNSKRGSQTPSGEKGIPQDGEFVPTEGGPDPLVVDVSYYARRVGLDAETYEVQTEDGFLIELIHIVNPRDDQASPSRGHGPRGPDVFRAGCNVSSFAGTEGRKKYPVLLMHGLLQSAGAFCCNDDDSLAFYLAKSGYDVWLGNNRCGFTPKHTSLSYGDPRMWAWNIRQMGVMDLPALVSRVLAETGFPKLALIAHSQGTTQTFVALAKEQRPDLGEKISVFCALAPAAYAGPLIGKFYFKIMRAVNPALFRMIFGIHSFIPIMMEAHNYLPAKPYSWMAYHVFSYLFSWTDARWDRGLRDRMFQFAPSYVSSESMRWWLGRECFAKQKCILATREEAKLEDKEDEEDDEIIRKYYIDREPHVTERRKLQRNISSYRCQKLTHQHRDPTRGQFAWYNSQFPPLALWVAGADDLVDGRRLLRRFGRGREPYVRVVHEKIIEGYEHLDVIWAMDAIEKVGKEVREVIWRTADVRAQKSCRVPVGCTNPVEQDPDPEDVPMINSGGRKRMNSMGETVGPQYAVPTIKGLAVQVNKTRGWQKSQRNYEETFGEVDELAKNDSNKLDRTLSEGEFKDVEEKANPLA